MMATRNLTMDRFVLVALYSAGRRLDGEHPIPLVKGAPGNPGVVWKQFDGESRFRAFQIAQDTLLETWMSDPDAPPIPEDVEPRNESYDSEMKKYLDDRTDRILAIAALITLNAGIPNMYLPDPHTSWSTTLVNNEDKDTFIMCALYQTSKVAFETDDSEIIPWSKYSGATMNSVYCLAKDEILRRWYNIHPAGGHFNLFTINIASIFANELNQFVGSTRERHPDFERFNSRSPSSVASGDLGSERSHHSYGTDTVANMDM